MKKYYKIVIPGILLVLFLIKIIPLMNINSRCVTYDDFLNESFYGRVINKYIDSSQHSYMTVEILNLKDSVVKKLILDFDTTNLFNVLKLKDTIYKKKNDDSLFRIISGKKDFISRVDFGCEH